MHPHMFATMLNPDAHAQTLDDHRQVAESDCPKCMCTCTCTDLSSHTCCAGVELERLALQAGFTAASHYEITFGMMCVLVVQR